MLNEKELELAVKKLRELNQPLTLNEIADKLKMSYEDAAGLMWTLTRRGVVKASFRKDKNGKLAAEYALIHNTV